MRPQLMRKIVLGWFITASAVWSTAPSATAADARRLNVLWLMADDLRPELGCYGSTARTPNLDRLAARGVLFERAYCQQAVCNPSRSSLLTGLRPDSTGIHCNSVHFRERLPDVVTLPQCFLRAGYVTRDVGKIFHNAHTRTHGDRASWSAPEFQYFANHGEDVAQTDGDPPPSTGVDSARNYGDVPLVERRDVDDRAYFDGRIGDEAQRVLDEIKGGPFFLAVGFWKPHAPFNPPARYWDLYDPASIPPLTAGVPDGVPSIALHDGRELRGGPPKQVTFTERQTADNRRGYWAGTSFVDAQVGRVLTALERAGLAESTVIVFTADHGYHLGEHGLWGKTSCFELDAHVPLILSTPSLRQRGVRTQALVELIDLFPTLVELCGLTAPPGLEGRSLAPLLDDPRAAVKPAAFTQHPRPPYYDRTPAAIPEAMGYSVRTAKVRYTEWREWKTGKLVGRELYDHRSDPQETRNTADAPGDPAAAAEAAELLHRQFPPEVPPADRGPTVRDDAASSR